MNKNSNRSQGYLSNIIYFLFVFSLVYVIGKVIELDLNFVYQVSIVLLIVSLTKFLIYRPMILPFAAILALIASALVNRYIREFIPSLVAWANSFAQNIYGNIQGSEKILDKNIVWFWIIILVLLSVFTSYFVFKKNRPWILLPVYMPSFIYYWYTFFDESLYFMSVFLVAFIFLRGLNSYTKERARVSNSDDYDFHEIYGDWRRTLLRYSILIILLASLIPKNSNYIAWPWLNRKVTAVFPLIEELRASEKYSRRSGEANLFDFSSTGFMGDNNKLGGPVILSDKLIMTVQTPKSIYLRGNVKERYTGSQWLSSEKTYSNYALGERLTSLADEDIALYFEETSITITNNLLASTTLFSSYMPYKVFSNDSYNILLEPSLTLRAPAGIYKDESYLVIMQTPLPYGKLKATGIDRKKSEIEDLDLYLQIPNVLSDRSIELTRAIVEGFEGDFQKALAIESYLRSNYKYNLSAEEIPGNSEFLDYFLFEGKEGYCTYYATAMAMMLRLEGIPSRYIEGYLVKDRLENGLYQVKDDSAHAWVEAFIEPVGWMRFEATPAYSISPRYENYNIIDEDISELEEVLPDIAIEDFEDLGGEVDSGENKLEDDRDIFIQPSNTGEFNYQYTLFTIIGIILLLFLAHISRNIYARRQRQKHFNKLSNQDKAIYLYRDIVKIASLLGYPQEVGETHFEYANRINYKFHNMDNLGIKEITDLFVNAKYSQDKILDDQVAILSQYKNTLEGRLEKHLGRIKYYYRKYIKASLTI